MTSNHDLTFGPEDRLEDALMMLASGVPLDTILSEAGDEAEWLRPLLETTAEVGELKSAVPIPPPDASLQKLLTHSARLAADSPPQPATSPPSDRLTGWLNLFNGGFRLATAAIAVLLVVILAGGALTVAAAQNSLPGESLYWLKQTGETVRLGLTGDPVQRRQLQEAFNQRRLEEARLLLNQDKEAEVAFDSHIQSLTTTGFELDGLKAQITPETEIKGQLGEGAKVHVEAITRPPDTLLALIVTVIEPAPAPASSPTPTFTPTEIVPPTAIPTDFPPTLQPTTPKAETTATPELESIPAPTDEPLLPLTPTATAPAFEPPPATPTAEIDNNDDFGDNQNNNGDVYTDDNFNDNGNESGGGTGDTGDGGGNQNSDQNSNQSDSGDGGGDNSDDHGSDHGNDDNSNSSDDHE
jgi:hypothetical protein